MAPNQFDQLFQNSQLEEVGKVGEVRRELAGEVLPLQVSAKVIWCQIRSCEFVGQKDREEAKWQ
jgi:hypothetical protein